MKVLVCGGRDYSNWAYGWLRLDQLHMEHDHKIELVINGGASGADAMSSQWARERRIQWCEFPANFDRLGKPAGPIRNEIMVRIMQPDLVVAFPGGTGTANCVSYANRYKIKVIEIQ